MAEVTIQHGNIHNAKLERLEASMLSLIGYIDLAYEEMYPIPLACRTADGPSVHEVSVGEKMFHRVKGLIARRPGFFVAGAWEGEVDLPDGTTSGAGSVYLGLGEHADGYIFEQLIPYELDKELAFVKNPGEETVLAEKVLREEPYSLIYAKTEYIQQLGRYAVYL